jgi:hypothetical protein
MGAEIETAIEGQPGGFSFFFYGYLHAFFPFS